MNNALYEMLNSANQAWTMYPGLSHGAYECLHAHGTPERRRRYLPKLVAGDWTGTMCLTEPHCGTDLGLLRTKAEPNSDGTYAITGTKIFISAGEHDMAENIVHLVLARLPDAPDGTKGISLFIVPKFMPNADGATRRAQRRSTAASIEHKMGIHGNATCVINLDGAKGWLVGEPNKGLNAMFVMMNAARLGVGMQALGLTEVAYQNALAYAKDRLQMRSLTGPKAPDKAGRSDHRASGRAPHAAHAEGLRRRRAARFAYWAALQIDKELSHADESRAQGSRRPRRAAHADRQGLPDRQRVREHQPRRMQIYGGHGFIAEWGMEQYVRDARINMIYEGTNTIQALDLLGRKILGDMGAKLKKFGKLVRDFVEAEGVKPEMQEFINPLADIGEKVHEADDGDRHEGLAEPGRSRRRRRAVPAYRRPPGVRVLLGADGDGRAGQASVGRSVLQGQARHRALLLRQAAAGNGDDDPSGARRFEVADGRRRSAVKHDHQATHHACVAQSKSRAPQAYSRSVP